MTELTDEAVKALLSCPFCGGEAEWKSGGPGCAWISCKTCPAETNDGSMPRILAAWNRRAERDRLRADAQAAVALVVERAADACVALADQVSDAALTGLPEQARLRESMEAAFTKASHIIRALAPADGLAAVEAMRKELDDTQTQLGDWIVRADEASVRAENAEAELAAAQQREAGLTDAVERLVVVLDRNDKKGPIPDVEMMFCWLAAQDIRAAFRAALSHNGRKGE